MFCLIRWLIETDAAAIRQLSPIGEVWGAAIIIRIASDTTLPHHLLWVEPHYNFLRVIKWDAVIEDFTVSFQNDFFKFNLVLLDQVQNFFHSVIFSRVQIKGPNIHLHSKRLPISLNLDKVPKLLWISNELKNVQNFTTDVIFARFDQLSFALLSAGFLSLDQNSFVAPLLRLTLLKFLH